MVKKARKSPLSDKLFLLALCVITLLFVGKVVYDNALSGTTPAEQVATNSEKKTLCEEGFTFYENKAYSLCYPTALRIAPNTNVIDPATGEPEADVITLSDTTSKSSIEILPSFIADGGDNTCTSEEKVVVSGYDSVRRTMKETKPDGCGEVVSVVTIVQHGQKMPFWIVYQANIDGTLRFINDYPILEQSLVIK